ncbi:hypothetical protein DAETH_04710 [Deinococcus aetherius]|uniref:Uncharacterized protein n=1 Tax=Deinococcus aetherius TaxID=200252 RepID=A0ABM8A9R4_9DEIO|nr:hypothetical protein DAETH_04710 [Deinococcus aetherius]
MKGGPTPGALPARFRGTFLLFGAAFGVPACGEFGRGDHPHPRYGREGAFLAAFGGPWAP